MKTLFYVASELFSVLLYLQKALLHHQTRPESSKECVLCVSLSTVPQQILNILKS